MERIVDLLTQLLAAVRAIAQDMDPVDLDDEPNPGRQGQDPRLADLDNATIANANRIGDLENRGQAAYSELADRIAELERTGRSAAGY